MATSRNFTPLILNSVTALAGAVIAVMLARATMIEASPVSVAGSIPRQTDRLAFVQPGAFALAEPILDPVMLKPAIVTEPDGPASWSTEIRTETPPPQQAWRFTLLPAPRPTQQGARPSVPLRTYTLKTRLAEIAPTATVRLAAKFEAAKAVWPPAEVALIAIKDEKIIELQARASGGAWTLIHRYRVLAASGGAGPKLRQGDRQVPEGIYGIAFLNPNSAYHVSLRVNYPNAFDKQMAALDGRKDLGGDIMIHGKNLSAGCLAMGDEAVEELFVLAAQLGRANLKLIISPTDFRQKGTLAHGPGQPGWLPKLYAEVATAMAEFKAPRSTGLLSLFSK